MGCMYCTIFSTFTVVHVCVHILSTMVFPEQINIALEVCYTLSEIISEIFIFGALYCVQSKSSSAQQCRHRKPLKTAVKECLNTKMQR